LPVAAPVSSLGPLNVSVLPDGMLTLTVTLADTFGNSGLPATSQVLKDVVAPAVPSIATWTQPVNQANALAFGCAGQAEALSTVLYRLVSSGGLATVASSVVAAADGRYAVSGVDVTGLAEGTLALTVAARDAAGNQSTYGVGHTALKDTVPPAAPALNRVTLILNAGNVGRFDFEGTGEAGATLVYTLASLSRATELSGTLPIGAGGTFSLSGLNTAALPDGTLLLHVLTRDAAGNSSAETHSASIVKDTVMPTLVLESPTASSRVNGSEVFRFTASEAPVTVRASLDGSTWVEIAAGTSALHDLPQFVALGDIPFTLTLSVSDGVGNVTVYNYDLSKDTAAPVRYEVSFEGDFVDQSQTAELAFLIRNGEVGSTYSYEISAAAMGRGGVSGVGTITSVSQRVSGVSIASLPQGDLSLRLWLTDAAGNVGPEVYAATRLGTTQVLTLASGWNAVGVMVVAVDSVAGILTEGAGRADGALVRGAFHGYRGGLPVALAGASVPQFGGAYRIFASRPGTLRIRGIAGSGVGTWPAGWAYAAPGADMVAADFPAAWLVWTDTEPGRGCRPLLGETLISAGTPIWIRVAP
jgi:hypothetical protein